MSVDPGLYMEVTKDLQVSANNRCRDHAQLLGVGMCSEASSPGLPRRIMASTVCYTEIAKPQSWCWLCPILWERSDE